DRTLAPGSDHQFGHLASDEERCAQVDGEDAVPVGGREIDEPAPRVQSSIVDDDIGRMPGIPHLCGEIQDRSLVGKLPRMQDRPGRQETEIGGELIERRTAVVRQAEPRAVAREALGDPTAKDTGRARDDDVLVLKFHGPPQRTRAFGSSRSRSQSPRTLTAKTTRNRQPPGKATIHQARSTYCRPTLMIEPQLGAGGWIPRPRNDRP